ncbi:MULTISPECIES: hypothetical protein [unclassified Microbulbifer]|uniref:hypothetical protein n=1 Tax=unclassified Microbulbifer TaxID=2619833 RepID=UPI0027E53222|nr:MULTISPECIES: hypothetical protein [unclassified Microbulbifer]
MNNKRIILAFVFAPLVPTIYFLGFMEPVGKNVILMLLVYSICFSYLPTLLLGLPLVSYLRKVHRLNLVNVVAIGAAGGMIVFYVFGFVFSAMLDSSKSVTPAISELIWGAILGMSVAIPFSLIAGIPLSGRDN